jgi:hypothetical protein
MTLYSNTADLATDTQLMWVVFGVPVEGEGSGEVGKRTCD